MNIHQLVFALLTKKSGEKQKIGKSNTVNRCGSLVSFCFGLIFDMINCVTICEVIMSVSVCRSVCLSVVHHFTVTPITVYSVRHDPICLSAKSNERNKLAWTVQFVSFSVWINIQHLSNIWKYGYPRCSTTILLAALASVRTTPTNLSWCIRLWLAKFSAHGIYLSLSSEMLGI